MFQGLVVTGLTPLCNTNEIVNWDNRPFNGKWPENQRSVRGSEVSKTIRKKPKRIRTAYSTDQLRTLEKIYAGSKYIDAKRRKELSDTLNIGDKALKIWFQNRRMKEKKESSESSDTSSDIISCQSPAKSCELNDVFTSVPIPNVNEVYEPAQCQFPSWNYNENMQAAEYQNGYHYVQNGGCFGGDTSVYPTQYYPAHTGQCTNGNMQAYGHPQTEQYNYDLDNWYAKSFDLTYNNAQVFHAASDYLHKYEYV